MSNVQEHEIKARAAGHGRRRHERRGESEGIYFRFQQVEANAIIAFDGLLLVPQ